MRTHTGVDWCGYADATGVVMRTYVVIVEINYVAVTPGGVTSRQTANEQQQPSRALAGVPVVDQRVPPGHIDQLINVPSLDKFK